MPTPAFAPFTEAFAVTGWENVTTPAEAWSVTPCCPGGFGGFWAEAATGAISAPAMRQERMRFIRGGTPRSG